MSTTLAKSKNVCYRCRKTSTVEKPLIACNYCTLFWHVECLIQPESSIQIDDWKCPRHQERSYTRKYKKKKALNGQPVKVIQEEDDVTFQEAEDIVKYGGVVHTMSTTMIENQFLDYARRSRLSKQKREDQDEYDDIYEEEEDDDDDSNDSFCIKATKQEAEEWLECIAYLQFYNYNLNGVQMLLDAANQYDIDYTYLPAIAPNDDDGPLKTQEY